MSKVSFFIIRPVFDFRLSSLPSPRRALSVPSVDPKLARDFAVEIVRRLRDQGHQALWAGGCVRDQLMGHVPKDYDVATDAAPVRIREGFGQRRTLRIG